MAPDEVAAQPDTSDVQRRRLQEALHSFIVEFSKESDRAAVILIGARLDYLLGELLSRHLLPNTASTDELLDTDRALGTFSARIHAAFRLGLVDADLARELNIFRRLRNTFAHETAGATLDHGPSRDRIRELAAPLGRFPAFQRIRERYFADKAGAASDFYTVSAVLVARLEAACNRVSRLETKPTALIVTAWRDDKDASGRSSGPAPSPEQGSV